MPNKPWYHRGLCFECTGCGACCTGAPGYVWVNRAEIEAMAAVLDMDVETFERRHVRRVGIRRSLVELPGGDCVFYDPDTRQCRVYRARPRQCRTWPFWGSNLESPEHWEQMAEGCPGANQGRRFALEEIQQRLAATRV